MHVWKGKSVLTFLVRSFDFTSKMIHHLARLLTGPKTTQMCSEDREQAFANVQPASVSVHARLLHLPRICSDPPTVSIRSKNTTSTNKDTPQRLVLWHRHWQMCPRNIGGDVSLCVPGQTDNPSVSMWYYLWRHQQHKPNIVLLAACKPSITITIGHRIYDVSVSENVDFEHPQSGHPEDIDWMGLHTAIHTEMISVNAARH